MGEKSRLVTQPFAFSITVPAGGRAYVDVPIVIPEGYIFGGFSLFGGESRNMLTLTLVLVDATTVSVIGHNDFTSAITVSGNINALFYK